MESRSTLREIILLSMIATSPVARLAQLHLAPTAGAVGTPKAATHPALVPEKKPRRAGPRQPLGRFRWKELSRHGAQLARQRSN